MSDKEQAQATTVAEEDLVKGLARLEKIAKGQITGKLPGNNEPKGRWAYHEEPDEVSDQDSDVSGDSGEEERDGKKSDTDYKRKGGAPVQKGMERDDEPDADGDDDDDDSEGDEEGDDDDSSSGGDGGGEPFVAGGGDKGDDKGDRKPDDKEVDKSFAARAKASKHIRSGVEVSPFLRDLVRSLGKSQVGLERRVLHQLGRAIEKSASRQNAFNKSLAEVLAQLGAVALEHGDLLKALGARPARGVKSQTHAVRPVEKSFGDGAGDGEGVTLPDGSTLPQLSRSVVMDRLMKGVMNNCIGSAEVVKFETTGIVSPAIYRSLCTDEGFSK